EARAVARAGERRDLRQQAAADAGAARPFADIEVFDIEAGATLPGRVVVEEKREAGGAAIDLDEQAFEAPLRPEAVAQHIGLADLDVGEWLLLVDRQLADQLHDRAGVCRRGEPDGDGHSAACPVTWAGRQRRMGLRAAAVSSRRRRGVSSGALWK